MTMQAVEPFSVRTIKLRKTNELLKFDHDGTSYRGVYYHSVRDKRGYWSNQRETAKALRLRELLAALFHCEVYDQRVVRLVAYIRATPWGAKLP